MTRAQITAKAEALLDAAGFTMNLATGYRKDPAAVAGKAFAWGDANNDLKPLVFYMRTDDPDRWDAGKKLADDMEAVGLRVDRKQVAKSVCFKKVMVEYDYHLYTGGYGYGLDPWECLHGLFHSSQYWAPVGWSGGYQGFCNSEFDYWADKVKNGATKAEVTEGVHEATYLHNKYVGSIGLWCSVGVHAYRVGWEGVVNHGGYGLTWGVGGVYVWSLFNMEKPGRDTVDWGFKANVESLSVVTSEWVWDWCILSEIYDSLIVRNPFNTAIETNFGLAESWSVGTWDGGTKSAVNFTIRQGVKYHDGTTILTPQDVEWGLEFIRNCGPGVAWNYMMAKDIHDVITWDHTGTGGDWGVVVQFTTKSYWALHLAGFLEFPSKHVWTAAGNVLNWGYNPATGDFTGPGKDGSYGTDDDGVMSVRLYEPEKDDFYPYTSPTVYGNGVKDLIEDGTGPWKWVAADPLLEEWYDLEAFRDFYISQEELTLYLEAALHTAGNVNYEGSAHELEYPAIDSQVTVMDLGYVARGLGYDTGYSPGIDWGGYWNEDADFDESDSVWALDLYQAGYNYLLTKEGTVY
jgi:hypothetical protein